ncbi:hypothetical protein AB6A40_003629 [Gnathostoma spinigerum]|uniref:phosphatidylserine decarboxylase n=1 Tax=Gnathostoma spinigerum TaxID=75299 RepID=A0ABD6EKX3_9BILA
MLRSVYLVSKCFRPSWTQLKCVSAQRCFRNYHLTVTRSGANQVAEKVKTLNSTNYSATSTRSRFISTIKWVIVGTFIGFGSVFLYDIFVPDERELQDGKHYYSDWMIRTYCSFPLNALSRVFGSLGYLHIPVCMRSVLLGYYVRTFGCRMDEALVEDLSQYSTFAEFFNRELKPVLRPISDAALVSPADGKVLQFGEVSNNRVEFVKGCDYEITEFLGPVDPKVDPSRRLYQMVIYLSPGMYHGFHSPARFVCENELHVPGLLLSVRPSVLDRLPDLLCRNERVVLSGRWKHGFFSMTAVAATSVGDISIDADPNLRTNVRNISNKLGEGTCSSRALYHAYKPGEKIGEFRLGSTIVLIFEAPPTITFAIEAGDDLKYGQSLIVKGV